MKKGVLYTIGATVILVICFVAFVLPSSLMNNNSQKAITFGKYNGKKIAYEYGSDFTNFISRYAEMFRNQGMQIDNSTQYYLFNYAFNSTVLKYAYEDAVKTSGYTVPKEAVNRLLRPYFFDENGRFSQKIYNQADASSVNSIKTSIESDLYSGRFSDDNFGSESEIFGATALYGLKESDAELDFIQGFGAEKRGFKMAAFKKADYPESEKSKFAVENAAKFVKYDLSVITCDDKSTADKAASRIAKGELTFEDAVTEYSTKFYSNTEGKITSSLQYQIENILDNKADIATIAGLSEEAVSPVIQTLSGYSIFKADGASTQPDFKDADTLSKVSSYINSYETTLIEDYFVAKAKDLTSDAMASDFDSACSKAGCTNVEIPAFPLNFGSATIAQSVDTSITGLRNADENEDFLKTAFSLKMNEISKPLVMDDYVIVIKYTKSETVAPEDANPAIDQLAQYDSSASSSAIMNSSKLENNFATVYYKELMAN